MTRSEKAADSLAALEELKQSKAVTISPNEAARVLACDPQSIREQVKKDPSSLGFPVCRMGTLTMIPRLPFLRWLTGEAAV